MPQPGKRWRHVIISTYASWLPGDPRGFRSRHHTLHSSGDYKNPPPRGEHEGLHKHSQAISGERVIIPRTLRPTIGHVLLKRLRELDHRVLALAVAGMHSHALIELPDNVKQMRIILGECKRTASVAVRRELPGRVWAGGGKFKLVDTPEYQRRVYRYVLDQRGAWIWSFKGWERTNS